MEKYDPIKILGEGSFGKVYLMRDKGKRNLVCVKIIKIKNIPKKERDATKMEVDLLRRLHHPNIVRYIDSFLSKNSESLCICMEYCDGGDLASQVKAARRNLFSESKILHWFVQIALGLHYMHYNKVLHRDLKTQNIFMLGNGRLVLGDLGISKVLDGTLDFAQTCIGTPYYMSPEIFKNKPYSYKSDVWALGCVLYEMTTLNHAFDATSLNGLACKIIKGRYPPIATKYTKNLRDLICEMLMTEPKQRPDLDQILRKPFIQKHIVNFFTDVTSRPSGAIGEGTMIVRAAVGVPSPAALSSDSNMLSLKKQLENLDMLGVVTDALTPKSAPVDYNEAKKLAKEQASALRREEDHRKMVEAALEKLRLERENKAAERAAQVAASAFKQQPPNRPAPKPIPQAAAQAQGGGMMRQPSNLIPPQVLQKGMNQISVSEKDAIGARREVRDGGMNWGQDNNARPSRRESGGGSDNNSVGSSNSNKQQGPAVGQMGRRPSFVDERERERDRDRRLVDERRKGQQEQEMRERAEDRRREEVRNEARLREESRLREAEAREREREEAAAKQKLDQLKAQADAVSRRDAQRERERARQRLEVEQLRRDKIELDRKQSEREQLREDRRADERRKIEENKKEQSDRDRFRGGDPFADKHSDNRVGAVGVGRNNSGGYSRAEEKEAGSGLSDKDRVLMRRQEKIARDEQDRLDVLREAENEYRRLRAHANQQNLYLYQESGGLAAAAAAAPPKRNSVINSSRSEVDSGSDVNAKYEFEPGGRNKPQARASGDNDDLTNRLTEVTKGKQSRYETDFEGRPTQSNISSNRPPERRSGNIYSNSGEMGHENMHSDEDEDGDDSELWEQKAGPAIISKDAEDDIHRREEELRAELMFATQRCEELKRTLNETKTIVSSKQNLLVDPKIIVQPSSRPIAASNNAGVASNVRKHGGYAVSESEDEGSDSEGYDFSDTNSLEDSWQAPPQPLKPPRPSAQDSKSNGDESVMTTPRQNRPPPVAVKESPYINLQDPPTPSGRLSDRIERLRQRCIEALGKEAFLDAYSYLKQENDMSDNRGVYEDDLEEEKIRAIKSILGEGKAHYTSLIEQLIFMEETHSN